MSAPTFYLLRGHSAEPVVYYGTNGKLVLVKPGGPVWLLSADRRFDWGPEALPSHRLNLALSMIATCMVITPNVPLAATHFADGYLALAVNPELAISAEVVASFCCGVLAQLKRPNGRMTLPPDPPSHLN